ncbi:MAG: LysR family transcriptional regulator, partial [Paracoccaceae bacterium]
MSNLSIRKMRIYLAAVAEGNFTRASVRENISQPAATIVINEIEETIGAQLFLRRGNAREAKVTEAGRMVTETFARIVSVYDNETSSIDDLTGGKLKPSRILLQRGFSDSLRGAWILSIGTAFSPCQISFETLDRAQIVGAVRGREAAIGLIDGMAD